MLAWRSNRDKEKPWHATDATHPPGCVPRAAAGRQTSQSPSRTRARGADRRRAGPTRARGAMVVASSGGRSDGPLSPPARWLSARAAGGAMVPMYRRRCALRGSVDGGVL
jgi:hypothetical protein